jgi:hypothetical protein
MQRLMLVILGLDRHDGAEDMSVVRRIMQKSAPIAKL